MVITSDETRIQILANWPMSHEKRVTRDNRKNLEYHVVSTEPHKGHAACRLVKMSKWPNVEILKCRHIEMSSYLVLEMSRYRDVEMTR